MILVTFRSNIVSNQWTPKASMGPFIKYVRKIFRKTTISNPPPRHVQVRVRGLEMFVFRKILRT